jgi:hypothetical protein
MPREKGFSQYVDDDEKKASANTADRLIRAYIIREVMS